MDSPTNSERANVPSISLIGVSVIGSTGDFGSPSIGSSPIPQAKGGKVPTNNRHQSVEAVTQYFKSDHLPEHLQEIAGPCESLKDWMLEHLPDSPELTVGLRKLLEAKDCFVRAKVSAINEGHYKPTSSVKPNG